MHTAASLFKVLESIMYKDGPEYQGIFNMFKCVAKLHFSPHWMFFYLSSFYCSFILEAI
jgi:hypothetical protein